jgi:multidrug efflux pump subunit AcrA (membrane-fusion protein)
LHGAQVQLDYTTVRAPFTGVIIAKAAQAGEIISPISAGGGFTRTGVGTIVDMDSLEIEVDVNEAYINRVQPNCRARRRCSMPIRTGPLPAHVIAIIPTADRSKATVKVRVAIDQKDPRILPDMGVRVSFLEAAQDGGAAPAPRPRACWCPQPPSSSATVTAWYSRSTARTRMRARSARARASEICAWSTGIAAGTHLVRSPPQPMNDGAAIVRISKQ